jgi:hypothetical protein
MFAPFLQLQVRGTVEGSALIHNRTLLRQILLIGEAATVVCEGQDCSLDDAAYRVRSPDDSCIESYARTSVLWTVITRFTETLMG